MHSWAGDRTYKNTAKNVHNFRLTYLRQGPQGKLSPRLNYLPAEA